MGLQHLVMRESGVVLLPVFKPWVNMTKSVFLKVGTLLLACAFLPRLNGAQLPSNDKAPLTDGQQFYKDKVRPILVQNCYKCHTDDPNSHLRVDSRAAVLQGGKRGPAMVPGDPEQSLLIEAVRLSLIHI